MKVISEPGQEPAVSSSLFAVPGLSPYQFLPHPPIEHTLQALKEVIADPDPLKGIDLEFRPDLTPTILSITTAKRIASVPWSPDAKQILEEGFKKPGLQWVAYSGVSADKPVVDKAFGYETPLEIWDDAMLTHYLLNQHLCKAPSKTESDDAGSLGLMNLWVMASLTTDMYNWKTCRGTVCQTAGPEPCPKHDPVGYCGVDSWAGVYGFKVHQEEMKRLDIPWDRYRELMETAQVCYEMETQGVAVNIEYVWQEGQKADAVRDAIFPNNVPFNPRSPKQVTDWAKANSVNLSSNSKDAVYKVLEKDFRNLGFNNIEDFQDAVADGFDLEGSTEVLNRLFEYKATGKGFDPWFGYKYLDILEGGNKVTPEYFERHMRKGDFGKFIALAHPRFIPVGASTGRLSSSKPNFMNIPKRGFGDAIRRAIIPRDESLQLLKADYKQLELRMCLFLAGIDQAILGPDAFTGLVRETGDQFFQAAKLANPKKYAEDQAEAAREISKRVSHAGDYLEGFALYDPAELETARIRKEIDAGALSVYTRKYKPQLKKDWLFHGKVVAFTGGNLALTLFRDKSHAARAKALAIQENIYFKKFFAIREWQMRVLEEIESTSAVRLPTGHRLQLFGMPHDKAKAGVAALGQGTSAHHVRAVMLRYKRELGVVPLIQVHDELVFERPKSYTDAQAKDFLSIMTEPTWLLPDFAVPIDAAIGPNWKDTRKLEA